MYSGTTPMTRKQAILATLRNMSASMTGLQAAVATKTQKMTPPADSLRRDISSLRTEGYLIQNIGGRYTLRS